MSNLYPTALRRLVYEFSKLPTIGEKSAFRLAYHLITKPEAQGKLLAQAILDAVEHTTLCRSCFFISETPHCPICSDPLRNRKVLCVVERPADVFAIERSGAFRGLYHVLHGAWSPLRGVTPEHIRLHELVDRVRGESRQDEDPLETPISELVLATGTTVEGDATALYIARELDELGLSITRIAQGIPKGGDLEFADELTINLSMEGRRRV